MNRSEPTVHDVDIAVDARIVDETAKVDWDSVTTPEASGFGLCLGLYRDVIHTYEKRRVAWNTALGGVLSISVMALVCFFWGLGPGTALTAIVGSQLGRTLWLYWKAHQSLRDVQDLEAQAIDYAKDLAKNHPVP